MSAPFRTRATNVLVIGSGGAGMRAVIAAGGINAALGTRDPQDS